MATNSKRRIKGEGTVYRDGAGWKGQIDLGWIDGKRRRPVVRGATKAEVSEKLAELRRRAQAGQMAPGSCPTVEAWFSSWLEGVAQRRAAGTVTTYRNIADYYLIPAVGRKRLDKVTPADFTAMTSRLLADGKSLRTAQAAHKLLSQALRAAVRQGVLGSNPGALVDAPAPRRTAPGTVTCAEAKKLLSAAQEAPHGALWVLALTTGCRQGELLALRWADLDLAVGVIHVRAGKTARARRTVPLTQVAREMLAGLEPGAPEALVFPSSAGTVIDRRNLLRAWHEFSLEVLGRRTTFHSLRHSAATLMLSQGVPLRTISDLLGHSSISITSDIYVETVDALKAEAAARMDGIFGNAGT
jgi:integrase